MKYKIMIQSYVALSGLVISLLAITPKVHRFKPSQGQQIFKGDKGPQYNFL
jgi:hypothetical protein